MIIGIIMALVTIIVLGAISPVLYEVVSTYSYFGTADKLIVQLFPLFIALTVLISILYLRGGQQQQY